MLAKNRLNRILIQGSGTESGREHVEINSYAFNGNDGPFPEIEIVNVYSVEIHSNAFYRKSQENNQMHCGFIYICDLLSFFASSLRVCFWINSTGEFKLNITNCAKVRIFSEAFANTTFHGHFEKIPDLILLERALAKSSPKITVHNCHLDEVQRLDVSLKEIKFSNSHIGTVRTNAFDVIKIDSIIFEHCYIDTIQANAFTEKVSADDFVAAIFMWIKIAENPPI